MNLNLFKTYARVVETQNLSRTAHDLGLSQPAVSKQIQVLEEHYGVLLLERSGRQVKTTEAGKALFHYAQEIIRTVEKAEKAMENFVQNRTGSIYLGASTIPGEYILPRIMKVFKEKNPEIKIFMEIGDTDNISHRVAERQLDLGVVGGWVSNKKVEGYPLLKDQLVLITPENHPLNTAEEIDVPSLVGEKWVFREKGSGTRKAVEDLLVANGIKIDDLDINMEAGSNEAVLASVESGMGIAIVSSWVIATDKVSHRKIKSLKISHPKAERFFYVIFPRQKRRRYAVEEFLNFLKAYQC